MIELAVLLLTILAPILSVGVVAWADKINTKKANRADEDLDEYIRQYLQGDPAGLIHLSQRLELLKRQADRKRHSTGQS